MSASGDRSETKFSRRLEFAKSGVAFRQRSAFVVIQLSPEAEARIRNMVERGGYDGPEAVVDEAPRVLEERDQHLQLKAAIAVGFEQYKRGESILWTPDYFDRLRQEATDHARSGKPIKDEAKP